MINIAKLLKDAPTGMKLYSPLFGECKLGHIEDEMFIHVKARYLYDFKFNGYGQLPDLPIGANINGECLLFPSKDCRIWEGWKLPTEPNFKVGDWLISNITKDIYQVKDIPEYFKLQAQGQYRLQSHTDDSISYFWKNDVENTCHLWSIADAKDGDVLATNSIICIFKKLDKDGYYIISPCIYTVKDGLEVIDDENDSIGSFGFKPATKEDRELLFQKMKEAGYEWDEKKKELRKIKPHYDIANFHAGMPVLVRDSDEHKWLYTIFGIYNKDNSLYPFVVVNMRGYEQCIPFERNEHLLGTTDMCDKQFINW